MQESKKEITNVSYVKMVESLPSLSNSFHPFLPSGLLHLYSLDRSICI